ncbi:DUF1330 domain-containing protein [Enterobacter soli]|jgi:uncharacterized protein (DUF1330 family)|uniref:DUF1330 domain-containing protein n=1 Tax=Enterobacter TaxID=547 RepID=UPI0028398D5C|nr:DUF1330 domain-containing protein [Enterobacter asburiae]
MNVSEPAYFIFDVVIHDPAAMQPYREKVEASYKAFGGKRLVMGGQCDTVEGNGPQGMLVMLQFDSAEQAHAWHDSPAYQEIIHYRHAAASTNAWLVKGVMPEQQ